MNGKSGTGGTERISEKKTFVNRTIRIWNRLPAETLRSHSVNQMLLETELEE
jgi:hypothetical protein